MTYLKNILNRKKTPQSAKIPGSAQVPNSAGGFAFAVDDGTRLSRFLVLGSEGGSYYATERKLTAENAEAVLRCIAQDGERVVREIVAVSDAGRAPKNDPAIFALALAASHGDDKTRRAALDALPKICRTGTHLFLFAEFVDGMRGWGRGLRASVGKWYADKDAGNLAYQTVKYQQRGGWSHRDLLRLSHPKPENESKKTLYHWVTQGWPEVGDAPHPDESLRLVWAFERAKRATTAKEIAGLVRDYRLPREAIPTAFLNDRKVWEALLPEMPLTALLRNLATLTRAGVFEDSAAVKLVAESVTDARRLRKARVHPIAALAALRTYAQGRGERGQNTWKPVRKIVDALDAAFYASFSAVEPTGKRWLLALDVSGSMDMGTIAGIPGLTPRVASAAMALITAATESDYLMVAFTAGNIPGRWTKSHNLSNGITPLTISPRQRLDDVVKTVSKLPMGGTDCALPMLWAMENKVQADVFVVYTDSETWAGDIHPVQALRQYRERTGIPAKLIVVGMVSNGFSIADVNDAGMMDVIGFDVATPQVMADFAR